MKLITRESEDYFFKKIKIKHVISTHFKATSCISLAPHLLVEDIFQIQSLLSAVLPEKNLNISVIHWKYRQIKWWFTTRGTCSTCVVEKSTLPRIH